MGRGRSRTALGARNLLRRAGLSVTRHPAPGTMAHELKLLLASLDVDLVVDVGAHHGEWAEELRDDVGCRLPIVSFEPDPESLGVLRDRAGRDAAWTVEARAVGDATATSVLHRFDASNENSLLTPSSYGRERYASLDRPAGEAPVDVVRLDEVEALAGANRIFLKIDTQGYEQRVLRGATGVLPRVAGLLVEMQPVPTYDEAVPMPELFTQIVELGFSPIAFSAVSRDSRRGVVSTFDGLFARPRT